MGALTTAEKALLRRVFSVEIPKVTADRPAALDRLAGPIQHVIDGWDTQPGVYARNAVLAGVHGHQALYWEWDEDAWLELTGVRQTTDNRNARLHLVALGHLLVPTPAGPTPEQLGTDRAFVALTAVQDSIPGRRP